MIPESIFLLECISFLIQLQEVSLDTTRPDLTTSNIPSERPHRERMEPPPKRPRFSFTQDLADFSDPDAELDLPPTTANDNDNDNENNLEEPEANPINLEEARARNDQRLKSIFESIFAKYEKDFTEVGDEIDLQSGRIIVNNGHLQRMEGEDDTGEKDAGWLAQLSTPVEEEEEEEEEDKDEDGNDARSPSGGYERQTQKWSESTVPVDGNADDDGDADDDTSSVDSLLDSALSVNRADRIRYPARATAALPLAKKAIPAVETAGGSDRVLDAVACCGNTTTATTSKHELVDPKWRVPDIDSKFQFTQPAVCSSRMLPGDPPSANNRKNPSNPSDKTKTKTKTAATFAHSVSPPGTRSLWAVPLPGRPRKTNADGPRPKKRDRQEKQQVATEEEIGLGLDEDRDKESDKAEKAKERERPAGKIVPDGATPTSVNKLKPYSSPMMASNWSSFSRILDGSDSDDPLQEYQPSPTPTSSVIRGRHVGSERTTPNRQQETVLPSPSSQSRCNGCRRLFPGNEEHVLHLRSVLQSGLPDGLHDGAMVRRILEKIDDAHARDWDSSGSTRSTPSLEAYESPPPLPPLPPPPAPPAPPEDRIPDAPKPKHRARARAATPDEAKLIITMRHVHRRPWKEILNHFPGKRLSNLIQWNQLHWTERRARPPPSSGPWSGDERGKLAVIKDEQGLSWAEIRKRLPGRTTMEIEFELLRLWVGDRIWNGDGQGQLAEPGAGSAGSVSASGVYRRRNQQTDGSADLDLDRRTIGDKTEIPDSRETSMGLSDLSDQKDGRTQQPQTKSNADSFGIQYEDQQPFDSIEYDDDRRTVNDES